MACPVCHFPLKSSSQEVKTESRAKRAKLDIHKVEICVTPCGHMFHTACLTHSFAQEGKHRQLRSKVTGGSCPTCQEYTTERQLYPAFYGYNDNASSSTSSSNSATSILSATGVPKGELQKPTPACAEQSSKFTSTLADNKSSDQEEFKELQCLLEQLRNEYQDLKEKCAEETHRADFNEGLVKSLQNDLQNLKQQATRKDSEMDLTDDKSDTEDNMIVDDDSKTHLE